MVIEGRQRGLGFFGPPGRWPINATSGTAGCPLVPTDLDEVVGARGFARQLPDRLLGFVSAAIRIEIMTRYDEMGR